MTMQMSQSEWRAWTADRAAAAQRVARLYERQSTNMTKVLNERGCVCNPMIVMESGEHGGPTSRVLHVTHDLTCTGGA